ncbi:hypothetical protein BHZ80_28590 [Salmonella enterica]|nr:hypothetical protein [Salmonella enterica]EAA9599084.1 hypothetical protein [Salmonella enterica]EAO9641861.1 hypothetical protein [Salmonella enterica]
MQIASINSKKRSYRSIQQIKITQFFMAEHRNPHLFEMVIIYFFIFIFFLLQTVSDNVHLNVIVLNFQILLFFQSNFPEQINLT